MPLSKGYTSYMKEQRANFEETLGSGSNGFIFAEAVAAIGKHLG